VERNVQGMTLCGRARFFSPPYLPGEQLELDACSPSGRPEFGAQPTAFGWRSQSRLSRYPARRVGQGSFGGSLPASASPNPPRGTRRV
jgi:hypothetical protein